MENKNLNSSLKKDPISKCKITTKEAHIITSYEMQLGKPYNYCSSCFNPNVIPEDHFYSLPTQERLEEIGDTLQTIFGKDTWQSTYKVTDQFIELSSSNFYTIRMYYTKILLTQELPKENLE